MGVCLSLDQEERKARARSDEIDRRLQTSGHGDHVIKILLLGKFSKWPVNGESINGNIVVVLQITSSWSIG